jgi:hypothetical protein
MRGGNGSCILPNVHHKSVYPMGTLIYDEDGMDIELRDDYNPINLDNYHSKRVLYVLEPDNSGRVHQHLRNEADAHIGNIIKLLEAANADAQKQQIIHYARNPNNTASTFTSKSKTRIRTRTRKQTHKTRKPKSRKNKSKKMH